MIDHYEELLPNTSTPKRFTENAAHALFGITPLVFFYSRHDHPFSLGCAAIFQAKFDRPFSAPRLIRLTTSTFMVTSGGF